MTKKKATKKKASGKKHKCTLTLEFESPAALVEFLEGRGDQAEAAVSVSADAPAPEAKPEPAPVVETEVDAPQTAYDVSLESEPETKPEPAPEPGLTAQEYINDVTAIYKEAMNDGVAEDMLITTVNSVRQKMGHPGVKLTDMSTLQLKQFHEGFKKHVTEVLVPKAQEAATVASGPGSFL